MRRVLHRFPSIYPENLDHTTTTSPTRAGLQSVYSKGGQLFIFESYFTCQDCFDKIPTYSLVDVLYLGESMTDKRFQEQIINPLFSINYESLKALGHFEFNLARHGP